MTTIALQNPWPVATSRIEKPAVEAHHPPASTVPALPDNAALGMLADHAAFRDRSRDNFTFHETGERKTQPDNTAPEPFPDLRFADPLPNLPNLDLPTKASAYQAALTVLRNDEPA